MLKGIIAIRELHTRAVKETGFTCADEMLYPENHRYLSDLLSYVAVGARSVEDQQHRLTASGVGIPVGMKNPTGGDISVMMNSMIAAAARTYVFIPGLGSDNNRKSICTRYFTRICGQVWTQYSKLSL